MSKFYLGLDIGTTGVKAVAFDGDGTALGIGITEYTLETPAPDIVELDAELYWDAAKRSIAQAVEKSAISPADIAGIGITGQAETLIVTDDAGKPIRKAIVWLDNRGNDEARIIKERFDEDALFRMSGQTEMLPCWPAAKILWIKRNEPAIFASAKKYLMVEDYVIRRLTGKFATCRGLMPSTLYYDIRTGNYDAAMLEFLGITDEQLPILLDAGEAAGICIENDSILQPGTVVTCGPIDHVCGNLGSGCSGDGMISETTGCSLALCAAFDHPVYDEEKRISTYLGFAKDSFVLLPWAPTAGMLLKHFRDEFANGTTYDELGKAASEIAPGSEGLIILPHCAGAVSPVCNPAARGVAYGVTLAHKRAHWARAIMEAVAYLLRDNVEVLRNMGCLLSEVRALGGAAKSQIWLQIMADVLNLPMTTTVCEEATSLGAAILARVACGDVKDAAEGASRMVRVKATVRPGADAEKYDLEYQKYRKLNNMILPTFGD